jgi:hypothetical protein
MRVKARQWGLHVVHSFSNDRHGFLPLSANGQYPGIFALAYGSIRKWEASRVKKSHGCLAYNNTCELYDLAYKGFNNTCYLTRYMILRTMKLICAQAT